MQDRLDQLLVEPGHPDQVTGVLGVRTQERGPDRRLSVDSDQRLPGTLLSQRWLGLGRDRRGRSQIARWPGRLARFRPARDDAWDAAGEVSANFGRVRLVLHLLQTANSPAKPMKTGPLSQPCGSGVGPRSGQGTTDRPGEPQQ